MSKKFVKRFTFVIFFCALFLLVDSTALQTESRETAGPQTLIRFRENFDNVTTPQIPAEWTVSSTGTGAGFLTTINNPDSPPNTVFTPSPATTSSATLTSPGIFILSSNARLNFRHRYSLENTWDGGVLEIKIGSSGQFTDILEAGGEFLTGGYTTVLNNSTNPLANRLAWSGGNQGNYANVSVKLPASAFRQTVRFRWVFGSNNSFGGEGWRIDSVTLEEVPTGLNTNAITISDNNPATPYPSNISVSGLSGLVTGVVVNLENFSHESADDVDILLVSPTGRSVTLMSDAGGNNNVSDATLTFDDAAGSHLPDNSAFGSGVYKPTNFEGPDIFPSPAPQTNPGSALNDFYGDTPNGIWSLYIVDDNGQNVGQIANGWNLSILSSVNACFFTVNPLFASFPQTGGSDSFAISTPDGCPWTATINNGFIHFDSTPQTSLSGIGSGVVGYNVDQNFGAGRTGLITITDGFSNRTFQIQQGSGCPFSLAQTNLSFPANGGTGSVGVTAGGTCVWNANANAAWIEITSGEQTGDGTLTFNVLPNTTGLQRSAEITVGARTLTVNQLATNSSVRFDFDGDGKADISVYRNGVWHLLLSTEGYSVRQFGVASDILTPADFDGDGKTDIAVFRDGVWYVLPSSGGEFFARQFGQTGDIPVPADFTGDGLAELAVYRNGIWFTYDLTNAQTSAFQFGQVNDKPVVADYDGDGLADYAVYRNGIWYLMQTTDGFTAVQFGVSTDLPVTGDFSGDGKADLTVYRGGVWHTLTNFQNYSVQQFGISTDIPVAADYDGDGLADIAVFRDGIWYILQTSNGQAFITQFGVAADKPVPNAFVY